MLDKRVGDSPNGTQPEERSHHCVLTHQPIFPLLNPDARLPQCMHARPLPTHPEFTIIHWPGFTKYHVEHWCLAHDGSRCFLRQAVGWSRDVVVVVGVVLGMWVHATWSCMVEWADVAFVGRGRGETCPAPCPHHCGDCTGIPPLDLLHPSPPQCALSHLPFPHMPLTHQQNPSSSSLPSGSNLKPITATPSFPSTPPSTLSPSWHSKTWSFMRACTGGT